MEVIDLRLKTWASPRAKEFIDAVNQHGSIRGAEKALGLARDVIGRSLRRVQEKATMQGFSPKHDMHHTVPEPYVLKGLSTYYDKEGQPAGQWVKMALDRDRQAEILEAAAQAMAEELPRLAPLPPPTETLPLLANLYVVTDFHFGMMAWRAEGGADWDLKIAEATLMGVLTQMIQSSPDARVGVLCQLGDFLHADGIMPVTPTSGHVLDADGRFSKVVQIAIRCLRRVVAMLLAKHEEVHVVMAEGNHDITSSIWLRVMFAALYEDEPRVTVNDSELPYYVYQHGETMLAFHHGHLKKRDGLPLLFAAQFPKVWGNTTKRYVHCGHQHHEHTVEMAGMRVVQHPTLAARDAYAARGGWIAERQASCITYHSTHGKVGEIVVTPEMVA